MSSPPSAVMARRLCLLSSVLVGMLGFGLVYCLFLQIGFQKDFQRAADAQHLDSVIPLPGRGRIFDVQGRVLAFTRSYYTVEVYPLQLRYWGKDGQKGAELQEVGCKPIEASTSSGVGSTWTALARAFKWLKVRRGKPKQKLTPAEQARKRQELAARLLSEYTGRDYESVFRRITQEPAYYVLERELGYEQGQELAEAIRKENLSDAIKVELHKTRCYPYGDTLGSVVGFVQRDSGRTGVEKSLNEVLTGIAGKVIVQRDGLGNHYRYPAYPDVQPVNGSDVYLTIDVDFQRIAFDELRRCVDSFGADGGSVVVMEPQTGAITAMCDYPYNDPRRIAPQKGRSGQEQKEQGSYYCRAVSESFEPGSVFKPVLGLAALESDNAERFRTMRFDVSAGAIEICGRKICDVHPMPAQDFPGIFIRSSNVGLSMLSMMVERSAFYGVMRKLGLGQLTGIELPHEDAGIVDEEYRTAPRTLSPLRVANNGFGQGVTATLLQLTGLYAAIANDGLLYRPRLVNKVVSADGQEYTSKPLIVRRAISDKAARAMKEILARVVSEGTGVGARSSLFSVCGKTGTAQKAVPGRGYRGGQTIASFVGFFPKEDPRYVVAVSLDNPRKGRFAGTIVCPTFNRISERIYAYARTRFQSAEHDLAEHGEVQTQGRQ